MKKFFLTSILAVVVTMLNICGAMSMAHSQTRTSIVVVRAYDNNVSQWYRGTGFFIARDTILTNYHVVNPRVKDNVIIVINNNKIRGKVFFEDKNEDLALVKIKTSGHKPFRLCDTVSVNDGVNILTRNPGYKTKSGVVSHIGFDRIYVVADIVNGDSGSPVVRGKLFNKCVVGVVKSLSCNKTTGVIDLSTVRDFLERGGYDVR
jgi:S1-C subfamily serine protease